MPVLRPLVSSYRRAPLGICVAAALVASSSLGAGQSAEGETTAPTSDPNEIAPFVHDQPTAREFEAPNKPDVPPPDAKDVDQIYRELTGQDFTPKPDRRPNSRDEDQR
jgi:hypothetical protein